MKSFIVDGYTIQKQIEMYTVLNQFAVESPKLGRLAAFAVVLIDVACETLKAPARLIERIAFTVLNLVISPFSPRYSIKDCLWNLELALNQIAVTPVLIGMTPLKFIYQLAVSLIHTDTVEPINYLPKPLQSYLIPSNVNLIPSNVKNSAPSNVKDSVSSDSDIEDK